ncbi:hybrid sensor histidine kinase/response regulator [Mongoliibacter ruber]|uniref:histidine kinase n=1 Tax=Mongoliibacter ruber TaxID=1750599 RepID=A0A2T0WKD7_9BACT|nr:hybrid sensor histidine kinase/response regulator [Mongoliibacter ruber]PRY87166.1 signal transduction histidine kinase [Mongoliibacter ruber]
MEVSKKTVLYVDDDADDFLLVDKMLKSYKHMDFELTHARSFSQAKEYLKDCFDAYLVDYRLGSESGLEVLSLIKKQKKHAPVIILTGLQNGQIDNQAMESGASDYLVKGGFDAQMLGRTIRYAIRDAELHESLDLAGRKFKNIFERAADPIVLVNQDSLVIDFNPSFLQKFSYNPVENDFHALYFIDILVEKEDKVFLRNILHSNTDVLDFEANIKVSPEQSIIALISVVIHETNKELYQIMIKDLTELKIKEEELYNLRRFSSTGRIARLLAHEVKNPLTTILLSAEQLGYELPENIRVESGDLIDTIKKNCTRINHLITELLESTRFTELEAKKYPLNQLLEEAIEEVEERIQLKNIKLVKQLSSEIGDVNVDVEKVKIAFVNILVNAIEALDHDYGMLRVKSAVKNNKCQVEISDNGVGIPQDKLDRLFEPFYTSKSTGSGLGLTNTQNIIYSHGGTIRVQSKEGMGTTFFIALDCV